MNCVTCSSLLFIRLQISGMLAKMVFLLPSRRHCGGGMTYDFEPPAMRSGWALCRCAKKRSRSWSYRIGLVSSCFQIPVPSSMSPSTPSGSSAFTSASPLTSVSPLTPAFASCASKSSVSDDATGFFFFFFFSAVGSNSPSAAGLSPSPSALSSLGFLDDFFFLPRPLKSSLTSSTAESV